MRTPAPAGRMFYRGFPEDGHNAPGSSRPTKIRHRTWFVKTVVGAHTAQPLAAPPLTDAAYPLRVACARPSPARWVSIERAHNVRPYMRYTNRHGGIYRTTNSATTNKFRGQVGRRRQSGSGCLQQIQRRGNARQYHLLCESHRRRVGGVKVG